MKRLLLAFLLTSASTAPALSSAAEVTAGRNELTSNFDVTVRRDGAEIIISASAYVAVSPDGETLVLGSGEAERPWFGFYSIPDGKLRLLKLPQARAWVHPRWSPDSKTVVVASIGYDIQSGLVSKGDVHTIDQIDSATGQVRTLVSGPGLHVGPFYSKDGKTIYYFVGRVCTERCRTIGSHYELFRLRIGDGNVERLTDTSFYQVSPGDESANGDMVYFGGTSYDTKNGLRVYDLKTRALRLLPIPEIEQIGDVRVRRSGQVYMRGRTSFREPYAVFTYDPLTMASMKLFNLLWETGNHYSGPSQYDFDGQGNMLHCWTLKRKAREGPIDGTRCMTVSIPTDKLRSR